MVDENLRNRHTKKRKVIRGYGQSHHSPNNLHEYVTLTSQFFNCTSFYVLLLFRHIHKSSIKNFAVDDGDDEEDENLIVLFLLKHFFLCLQKR